MSRSTIHPIEEAIPAARQQNARHYGVHPYFTRRPPNVVRAYIERYTHKGDVVCDPFGGTGVTAIEACLLGRNAIHNDLNPFANFITQTIADTELTSTVPLMEAFSRVEQQAVTALAEIESSEKAALKWLKKVTLPENITLPRNSDAKHFYDMFTSRQLAGLAVLKKAIDLELYGPVRDPLLLAWSASIAKLNKTFLSAKGRAESRGGSSIFSIYRYKLASNCVELPIWETFRGRFKNVLAAKEEVLQFQRYRNQIGLATQLPVSIPKLRVLSHDAAKLDRVLEPESVDYIFTDPPYGAFITYLDLSILWNHWLGFAVSDEALDHETIVGGERNHSEDHYRQSLAASIQTSFRLLRPDRWLSIVFQHWDLSYFATILETAQQSGAELKAAITQTGDVIWSMHKKKNSASLLAGEMILTFYKPESSHSVKPHKKTRLDESPTEILSAVFDECLSNGNESFTSEALFNRLVIELWKRHALGCLSLDRREFAGRLEQLGWHYDSRTHLWSKNGRIKDCLV